MKFSPFARYVAVSMLAVVTGATYAGQSVDINVNDDSARIRYARTAETVERAQVIGDGSLLYSKDDDTDDRLFLAAGGLQVAGDVGARPHSLIAGVGGRLYWAHGESDGQEDVDGAALGLGGEARFSFHRLNRLVFAGHLYFAPDILSFADVDQLLDYALRVEYQILRPASIYLGYRQVKVKRDGGANATVDSGAHLGFKLDF